MTITLRPAADHDLADIARLLTFAGPDPVTENDLREDDARQVPGKLRARRVARDPEGRVVGQAWTVHFPSESPGLFHIGVSVDPACRGRGIGRRLYDEVVTFARANGATTLAGEVPETDPVGCAFAEARGFRVYRHARAAVLDLAGWDPSAFGGRVARAVRSGVRLTTYSLLRTWPDAERSLYEINRIATTHDPAALEASFPTFEVWQGLVPRAVGFQPEGQWIALRGGEFVGLSALHVDPGTGEARTLLTGVHPDFRSAGIATALKVCALRHARESGARTVVTEVDASNVAMGRINERLGFVTRPGVLGMIRRDA